MLARSEGPSKEGLEAIAKVAPLAWRYTPQGENTEFLALLASTEHVKPEYVLSYPGSGTPLANLVPAFTSPTRSWVMASPGYGSGAAPALATGCTRSRSARTTATTSKR